MRIGRRATPGTPNSRYDSRATDRSRLDLRCAFSADGEEQSTPTHVSGEYLSKRSTVIFECEVPEALRAAACRGEAQVRVADVIAGRSYVTVAPAFEMQLLPVAPLTPTTRVSSVRERDCAKRSPDAVRGMLARTASVCTTAAGVRPARRRRHASAPRSRRSCGRARSSRRRGSPNRRRPTQRRRPRRWARRRRAGCRASSRVR